MAPLSSDSIGDEPIPELLRLGEQLAQAREGAGLSLDALSQRLKVEPRLLQALERGEHHKLPEGVFIVALARRIAGSLNTNVEEAIANVRQSRLMQHRPPGRTSAPREADPSLPSRRQEAAPQASGPQRRAAGPRPSDGWRWPLAALLTACGAAAAWLLMPQAPNRIPSSPTPGTPSPPPPKATQPRGAKPPEGGSPGAASPVARKALATAHVPSPSSPGTADTLRLQASEPSWVQVRAPNGPILFEGTLSGEKSFPLGRGLEVMAGRPYAVRASIGPGPASPLGGVDDIRWKRFSPRALTPEAPPSSPPSP